MTASKNEEDAIYQATVDEFFNKVKAIVENSEIRQANYLVKNGMPFDVAYSLSEEERFAHCIIFSEFERSPEENYNFETRKFNEKGK